MKRHRSDHSRLAGRGATNCNPADIGLWALLVEDLRTYDCDLLEQGLWVIWLHRLGNWRMNIRIRLLRIPFSIVYRLAYKAMECITGISLHYTVPIGRRVRIYHHSGIILHAQSIGNDLHVRQNTTMGVISRHRLDKIPTIGDRVDIGCNVCILGSVTVGDDAVIGAGAVVIHDVPPGATVVGVPARVVKMRHAAPVGNREMALSEPVQ